MISQEQLDLWGKKIIEKLKSGKREEDELFISFNEGLARRLNENKDAVICVCGERGMGKTSYAIVSAMVLKHYGLNFDFEKNVFYGHDDMKRALKNVVTTKKSVFIFDEMIDFAYSREAMSATNRTIVKILTKARKLNHIYFFCIPRFKALDSHVRDNIVHYWIEVYWKSNSAEHDKKYAYAALFSKDKNPATDDPWGIEFVAKKRYRSVHGFSDTWKVINKFNSFICDLTFPAIPQPIEKEYEDLSRKALASGTDEAVESFEFSEKKKELRNMRINESLRKMKDTEINDEETEEDREEIGENDYIEEKTEKDG